MEPRSLDPELMAHLIASEGWQRYVAVLLADYDRLAQAVDTTERDHRWWQGMKQATRRLIEIPYEHAGLPSPLGREGQPSPFRPLAPDDPIPDPAEALPRIFRPGYLA